jgi:hypothetical protein
MKRLLISCVFLGFVFSASAQSPDDNFKIDFSAGYAKPTEGFGVKPGVIFVIEPHYFVLKNFAVGLRFEGAFLGYQARYDDEVFSFFGSSAFTGEIYFSRGAFRPFIGAGGGLFTRHYIFLDEEDDRLYTSGYGVIKLGAFARAGFEAGHLRFSGSYNLIGNNFCYAAFTIGYVLGDK